MNKLVIADPELCIGCRTCEIACVLAHAAPGAINTLSAATFKPRLTVVRTATVTTAVQCRQCEDAPCVAVCPSGALVFSDRSIQVMQARCIGCRSCVMACSFGVIELAPGEAAYPERAVVAGKRAEVVKCDLCAQRTEGPACMEVCPMAAISLMDAEALAKTMRRRREQAASALEFARHDAVSAAIASARVQRNPSEEN